MSSRHVLAEDVVEGLASSLVVDGRDDVALLQAGLVGGAPGPRSHGCCGAWMSSAVVDGRLFWRLRRGRAAGSSCRSTAGRAARRPAPGLMIGLAMLIGIAKPMPCASPATAVLTPITAPVGVDQCAAGVARIDRRVGLDEVAQRFLCLVFTGSSPTVIPARGRNDAGRDAVGERAERTADRHRQLAGLERSTSRRSSPREGPCLRP